MKKQSKTIIGKIFCLVMIAVLTLTLLCSCGGGTKTTLKASPVDPNAVEADSPYSVTQLDRIAETLASAYSAKFDTREMIVAAVRGYDMLNEVEDVNAQYPDRGSVNVEAAKAIIAKADEANKEKLTFDYSNLTEQNVRAIAEALAEQITIDNSKSGFDALLCWIGAFLQWMTNSLGFGSYIVGICIFSVLIELLMLPFAIKQQKNSIRQAKLRPKEMAIKKKYAGRNDQKTMQKMQEEIQALYQAEHFSPYSGCLPLLIQMPIIIALYNIVIDPLHYVMGQASALTTSLTTFATASPMAGGLGMSLKSTRGSIELLAEIKKGIENFSGLSDFLYFRNGSSIYDALAQMNEKIPNFNIGSQNFGLTPSFTGNWILLTVPVLTFAVYFLTSKLNRLFMGQRPDQAGLDPRQAACSNAMMDVTMPAMSTYFTFIVPAIVGVYWIFRALLGVLKQFILSKVMPLPVITEEDIKAAQKELAGKKPAPVRKSENAGAVRSLHHIDDEDFEDTRERALARKALIEQRQKEAEERKAKNTPFGKAELKKDDRGNDQENQNSEEQ